MFIVELHQGCLAGRDRRDEDFYRSSGSTSGLGQTVTKLDHHHRLLMISQYLLVQAMCQITFCRRSHFLSWKFPGEVNVKFQYLLTINISCLFL